jgi:ubiquinone/menaquinone biosynthesis C-methylase UbiE
MTHAHDDKLPEDLGANAQWSEERIRDYWTEQARQHQGSPAASWSDVAVMEMEIRHITAHLDAGDQVLDVGCANGFSTLRLALARKIDIVGIDYIPGMVDCACKSLDVMSSALAGTVRFEVGDALRLAFPDNSFDKVIAIRVVINLGAWEKQQACLQECVRVLRPGGMLLLSEATVQGWRRLNALRLEWGLPAIPMPHFNNYLDEEQVIRSLAGSCECLQVVNFASTYYVGTRVFKPLLARLAGKEDRVADPFCEINRWLSELPAAGDYGTQKLFLFRKRGP